MVDATENTVNDLMASYLRNNDILVTTYPSARIPSGRRIPDFEVLNSGIFYGEGEWASKYLDGFNQAIEFGDIPGSTGYFLIGYPDKIKDILRQRRLVTSKPEVLLGGVIFRGVFKIKGMPPSLFRGGIEEIIDWFKSSIEKERREDPSEFVNLMGEIVQGLTNYLPTKADYPSLFEHIIANIPKEKGGLEVAKKASAYLLLNQVVFYSILKKRGLPPINYETLKVPAELYTIYFKKVVDEIDYNAIFDFDVASIFPKKSIQYIKDMVRIVSEIQPEEFTRDLLGNVFHSLIPLEVRKPVAAYYTNPMAARLLAKLSIHNFSDTVADFACGSGTLLMAAYERKAELLDTTFTPDTHRQFIENDITGIDIMPFAAHLAVIQLALKNPSYLTDRVRIGVHDSTGLNPGDTINVLQQVLPRGQQSLSTYVEDQYDKSLVVQGAISGKGGGREFKLSNLDVVIMNPPFTRQEKIPYDFKLLLKDRFGEYNKYLNPQMGLRAYFILLADRFLNPNGRMALVLPATTLRVESMRGIREMMALKYDIEYIITTDYRSAFSESTALRELLIIARKRNAKDISIPCIVTNLKALPNNGNINEIEKILVEARSSDNNIFESDLCEIFLIEQKDFLNKVDDWSVFLPSEPILEELIETFSSMDNVSILEDQINPKNIKRCDYSSIMHVAWERDAKTQEKGNILKKVKKGFLSRSKLTGNETIIPNSVTLNGMWALSGIWTIDVTNKEDKIIYKSFKDSEQYFNRDVNNIFKKWGRKKLSRYASDFFVPRKIDFCARGTAHLAVRTDNPSVPSTSIWGFGTLGEKGKLLSIFFNSTLGITLMLKKRIEIRGSWSQFSKKALLSLPVPDFNSLDDDDIKKLLNVYKSVKDMPFPSLVDQFSTSFEGLMIIDKGLFSIIGLDEYMEEKVIMELHLALTKELEELKEMMDRD